MQTKTALRFHLILLRMAIIKRTNADGDVAEGTLCTAGETGTCTPLWKSVSPYDPAILIMGTDLLASKSTFHRDTCTSMGIVALLKS